MSVSPSRVGDAYGIHIITVETQKYFNKNIYNTTLKGYIFNDWKTQKP